MRQAEPGRALGPWPVPQAASREASLHGPHYPCQLYPARYLRPGSSERRVWLPAVTAETQPSAPSLVPQGRACPGASCSQGENMNKAQRTRQDFILFKLLKLNTHQHPSKALPSLPRRDAGTAGERFLAQEPQPLAGGGGRACQPSRPSCVACLRLLQGSYGWSGPGPGRTGAEPGGGRSGLRAGVPLATPVHVAAGVSPPALLSAPSFPANCHKHTVARAIHL